MKYTGKLGKRRPYKAPPGSLASPDVIGKHHADEANERGDLMLELFRYYGVTLGDWVDLAMRLAEEHVPAFQREQARDGPKPVWDFQSRALLRIRVDEYVAVSGRSLNAAYAHLARQKPWKEMFGPNTKKRALALKAQYLKADPAWVQIVRDAAAMDRNTFALYEQEVKTAITARLGDKTRGDT